MNPATAATPVIANRGAITACVILSVIMQALDTTIANVALPYIQGSVAASADQINWVLTSYIVAAAVMTPPSGYLANRFGRKRILMISITGFVAASVLCGLAQHYADGSPALLPVGLLMGKRATVRGLIVYDFADRQDEWLAFAGPRVREGRLVEAHDTAEGLESAPTQLVRVAAGHTIGRPLVRISA